MKQYSVIIVETYSKTVKVETEDKYEALSKVSKEYSQTSKLALTDEDYKETEIYVEGNEE